jgi:hypothetical protein
MYGEPLIVPKIILKLIKVFAGVQGAIFSKSTPWLPEAKDNAKKFFI